MLLTLSLALAAPSLRIDSRYLASGGPVVVELDEVDPLLAPELARSVRLRGPDGEIVRWSASLLARDQGATIELLPDAGAGVHVLERCVTYSEEGHLRAPGEPGQPACYAVERVDIVPATPPALPAGVRFERGLDALYAEVPWDAGLRYSLEVKGVGRVGGQTVPMPEGQAR
ncbi:MAG: hypothetical protein KC656_26880, partial [Myxococcales bacterium]|nr:hypothetical protein [Myxococcales bacterium]